MSVFAYIFHLLRPRVEHPPPSITLSLPINIPQNTLGNTQFSTTSFLKYTTITLSMDSQQDIKQRIKNPDEIDSDNSNNKEEDMKTYSRREKRMVMAKRGIRSLALAVSIPLSLTLLNIYFFSSSNAYGAVSDKPFWFPPLWALHFMCLASSFLMGLSAWLVWAEGGFHKKPAALSLYLAQLGLGLIWDPIVFRLGATWVGLVVCLAVFGALAGCSRQFKAVNPIAGDLVKPCLAWAAFLAVVNLKLVFL